MLVTIEALCGVVLLEAVSFEVSEETRLDRNLILANNQSLALAHWLVSLVPGVRLDLVSCQALIRVRFEDFVYQVNTVL